MKTGKHALLEIEQALAMGADDDSDELALQLLRCQACGKRMVGVYEESRRGGDSRFHHWAYEVSEDVIAKVAQLLAEEEPKPRNRRSHAFQGWLQGAAYSRIDG